MRAVGGGSIISTASVAGLLGSFYPFHAYSAAKAAVINFARTAAIERAKDAIRVNCICPGLINTPLVHASIPGGEATVDPLLSKTQPLKRAGQAQDIANMATYLSSDEARWVTGAAMVVVVDSAPAFQFSSSSAASTNRPLAFRPIVPTLEGNAID